MPQVLINLFIHFKTTIIMKSYVNYPQETKGWSVINGELSEVTLLDVVYYREEDELKQKLLEVSHQGDVHYVKPSNYYESEADYCAGKTMPSLKMSFLPNEKVKESGDGLEYWMMEKGEPTRHFLRYDGGHKPTNKPFELDGLPDINTIFRTREECLTWSEYVVSYEDGRKETRKGAGLLLQLTEEQKKAVKSVERALRKASALGVAFCECYDEAYAINTSELQDFTFGCDCDEDYYKETQGMDEMFNILRQDAFRCNLGSIEINEDYRLFFKRK